MELAEGVRIQASVRTLQIKILAEHCAADKNSFQGVIQEYIEYDSEVKVIVEVFSGERICTIVSAELAHTLDLHAGKQIWVCFPPELFGLKVLDLTSHC
jgi:molybdopterin-binding protein